MAENGQKKVEGSVFEEGTEVKNTQKTALQSEKDGGREKNKKREKKTEEKKVEKYPGKKPGEEERKIGEPEREIKELTETLKRVQAEFENYQKRIQKQNEEEKKFAGAKMAEEILPVLDTLEQGIIHNPGLVGVSEQLVQALGRNGVEKIEIKTGDAFDHYTMDCMMQESDEKIGDGKVVKVLLNGYKMNGKVLRHAKVSVNKLEKGGEEKKQNDTKAA